MTQSRQQMIFGLKNCGESESDRLCNRLQQCNVRICRYDGSTELTTDIRTPLQLAHVLDTDSTIENIQYLFNGKWVIATA